MKLEKLAATAEIVSSVAILITLIYLAVQTDQNTTAINSASRGQLLASESNAYVELADSGGAMYSRLTCENFDPGEQFELALVLEGWLLIKDYAWREFDSGALDEASWNASVAGLRNILGFPPARQIWQGTKQNWSAGFVEYVDAEIPEASLEVTLPDCETQSE